MRRSRSTLLALVLLTGCVGPDVVAPQPARPHILLILADDLGYSDLGSYGSEIPTPHLDGLAGAGLRAADFYVSCQGGPSRAMLLTGVDNNLAGLGISGGRRPQPIQAGLPAYAGHLSDGVVSVASLLRDAGYYTVAAGKWSLGEQRSDRPAARGFERSFVLHDSAASHWADMRSAVPGRERARYTRDGRDVQELPADYFSTRALTDFVIEGIGEALEGERRFFAYLSYQAPHGPLADEGRDDFSGRYDDGYDAIRKKRLLRMKILGLVDRAVRPFPGIPTVPRWSDLSSQQQQRQARRMELYASMVAGMDFHVGRLLDYLREAGAIEDTLIVFLSDSGPEPRQRPHGSDGPQGEWRTRQFPLRDTAQWGHPGSFVHVGPAWAQVSSVPFRLFKGTLAEGGIRSPLIVSGAGVRGSDAVGRHRISHDLLHVMDLAPTFLELAGVPHPESYRGRPVVPLQGRSLVPLLRGGRIDPRRWQGFAYADMGAVRDGPWKLIRMPAPFGVDSWRLYRLDHDPSELFDLSAKEPGRVEQLTLLFERYALENGIVLPPLPSQNPSPSER
jgi:arylsulfatase A-like enzyme